MATYVPTYNPFNGSANVGSGPATVLWQQTGNLTASGNSGNINMAGVSACWLSIFAAGSATGTSPTLDVYYGQQDAAGNLLTGIVHAVQLTTAPNSTSINFGLGVSSLSSVGGGLVISNVGQVQWVLGGTSPVFNTVTISLIGR